MPTPGGACPCGACLCGAVRWQATVAPKAVHHCHCGMCRRWTGAAFATLAYDARDDIAPTVGSMDEPQSVMPTHHYGIESRLPWMDISSDMPGKPTQERWR